MASRREQIIEAIRVKLATIPGITTYRSRLTAITRGDSSAIVVRPALPPFGEEVVKRNNDLSERELMVIVEVVARGETADKVADPFCVSAHAKVMEDQTLGGLCLYLREVSTHWLMDDADLDVCVVSTRYRIHYRTAANTLN
ncbi:MAG: hypothetical protein L0210_06970 [Rhodospirillales bacterium]|nr:hypothetical protein [Rhodospirillales bacterium]